MITDHKRLGSPGLDSQWGERVREDVFTCRLAVKGEHIDKEMVDIVFVTARVFHSPAESYWLRSPMSAP